MVSNPVANFRFPRWSGPLIGAIVGAILGARDSVVDEKPLAWEWLIGGMLLGLLAGCIVFLLDRPATSSSTNSQLAGSWKGQDQITTVTYEEGALVGRLLAVLSIALSFFPFVGLGLGVVAVSWQRVTGLGVQAHLGDFVFDF